MSKSFSTTIKTILECRRCWGHLVLITALNLASMPLTLLYPLPLKIVVDTVLGAKPLPRFLAVFLSQGPASELTLAIAVLLGLALSVNLQGLAVWYLQTVVGEKLVWDFRARLLDHVQRLPLAFHDRYGVSDSVYRIQHDAPAIQYLVIQGFIPLLTALCTLAGMIFVTARIDPLLAIVALAITPALFLLTTGCSQLVRRRAQTIKELDSSALSVVQEVLGCIRVIKAYGQEGQEYERFVRRSTLRQAGQVRLAVLQAVFNMVIGLTIAIGTAAALYIGVRHVRNGLLTVGSLLVVMAYIAQMYQPLQLLSTKATDLQNWMASLARALELLDKEPEIEENPAAQALVRARGDLEFRNVSFTYSENGKGLENVSFQIPAGARVGIVGATGAGKTTLLNLMMRFYDPIVGAVLLDGVDLRLYRIRDLRRQFSVVLQEPILFSASISENIAYGMKQASNEEIVEAAKRASAHEFIMDLPDKYETSVGERGVRLSGGERQRISLARAFLRDSPVLILDEPTSSIDQQTEQSILEATESLMRNRTTFMIAHRLNTLRSCDTILVLDQGRLIEVQHPKSAAMGA